MKKGITALVGSVIAFGVVSFASIANSQSVAEKELDILSLQREAAVLKAIKPINDQYRKALEPMLTKATQAGDLDLAIRIREEISKSNSDDGFLSSPTKMSKRGNLISKLIGTSWLWGRPPTSKFTFLANGKFEGHMKFAKWTIVANDVVFYTGIQNEDTISGIMKISGDLKQMEACEWSSKSARIVTIVVPPTN